MRHNVYEPRILQSKPHRITMLSFSEVRIDELEIFARVRFDRTGGLAENHSRPEFNIGDEHFVFGPTHTEVGWIRCVNSQAKAAPKRNGDLREILSHRTAS